MTTTTTTTSSESPVFAELLEHIIEAPILWNLHLGNSVEIRLITDVDFFSWNWEPKTYEFKELHNVYLAESGDGRAEAFGHTAAKHCVDSKGNVWQTPQSEGFAGRVFTIHMKDGKTVHLRGPWHGVIPQQYGYQDISVKCPDVSMGMYTFGLKISFDFLKAIVAKFHPELPELEWHEYSKGLGGFYLPKSAAPQEAIDECLRLHPYMKGRL